MVNDLKRLLRENVVDAPPDQVDVAALMDGGRRRMRARRNRGALVGASALLVVAATTALLTGGAFDDQRTEPATRPTPNGPVLQLADSEEGVDGADYTVLTSHTNQNLDRVNGQYFDGVTEDGMILFRDGPRGENNRDRLALLDPATGEKDWLPEIDFVTTPAQAVELSVDRLVFLDVAAGDDTGTLPGQLVAHVLDRASRSWSAVSWPTMPEGVTPNGTLGPDGRLYLQVLAHQGRVPEGGWPTGPDGDAEDADADGSTYDLWSVSLSDPDDVRDEGLRVGSFVFTDSTLVWTDSTNGHAGNVHVRELSTGQEHSFDPHAGPKCNLLGLGATDNRVVLNQYCGTYPGGVRDDRVQVLSTDGDPVVTLQDNNISGYLNGYGHSGEQVLVESFDTHHPGTYVYDLATDRFVQLSDAVSSFGVGGPTPDDTIMWHTPFNRRHGATQWLAKWTGDS